jgi:hypothetical protein
MRAANIVAVVAAASSLLIAATQAQSQPKEIPPLLSQPPNQGACPPNVGGSPPSNETTGSGQSLSDRLAASKGVICPPAGIDPGIAAPPVGGGRTPVIPPLDTPGGDPNVRPR